MSTPAKMFFKRNEVVRNYDKNTSDYFWYLNTNIPGKNILDDYFYITTVIYKNKIKSSYYWAYSRPHRYTKLLNSEYFTSLDEAKYFVINKFYAYLKTISDEKERIKEINKINNIEISFKKEDYFQAFRGEQRKHKSTWYLQSNCDYLRNFLKDFRVVYIYNNTYPESNTYSVIVQIHRAKKPAIICNFKTLDEAKYFVINKYFEFINYYKAKNYCPK